MPPCVQHATHRDFFCSRLSSCGTVSCMCREINRGGLPMLYEIILDIAGPEIKCALEVGCQTSTACYAHGTKRSCWFTSQLLLGTAGPVQQEQDHCQSCLWHCPCMTAHTEQHMMQLVQASQGALYPHAVNGMPACLRKKENRGKQVAKLVEAGNCLFHQLCLHSHCVALQR